MFFLPFSFLEKQGCISYHLKSVSTLQLILDLNWIRELNEIQGRGWGKGILIPVPHLYSNSLIVLLMGQIRGKESSKCEFLSALVLTGPVPASETAFKEDHHSQLQSKQMR